MNIGLFLLVHLCKKCHIVHCIYITIVYGISYTLYYPHKHHGHLNFYVSFGALPFINSSKLWMSFICLKDKHCALVSHVFKIINLKINLLYYIFTWWLQTKASDIHIILLYTTMGHPSKSDSRRYTYIYISEHMCVCFCMIVFVMCMEIYEMREALSVINWCITILEIVGNVLMHFLDNIPIHIHI